MLFIYKVECFFMENLIKIKLIAGVEKNTKFSE